MCLVLSIGFFFGFLNPVRGQPAGILERAFFYNDIYHFVGHPFPSPAFGEIQTIAQPFVSKCSNLNRIILPFYKHEDTGKGRLIFNLYQTDENEKPIFSVPIDTSEISQPKKIGTHNLKGTLYDIWIPPQTESKGKAYFWELKNDRLHERRGVGLYLTDRPHPQLQPLSIDGTIREETYAAFYSYCQYRFDGSEMLKVTLTRLDRERYFVGFYLLLVGGVAVYITRLKR